MVHVRRGRQPFWTSAYQKASNLAESGHPISTVPMGGPQDPRGGVDAVGAVKRLTRLRMVDDSIIPEVPSTATYLTAIMVAERIHQRAYSS